jgi:hypothetical protein
MRPHMHAPIDPRIPDNLQNQSAEQSYADKKAE